MVQSHQHKVLLVGSGMMTPPLLDYLVKFGDTHITVASNILEDAQKVAAKHPTHISAMYLDVFDVRIFLFFLWSQRKSWILTMKLIPSSFYTACRSRRSSSQGEFSHLFYPTLDAHEGPPHLRQGGCQRCHFKLYLTRNACT